MPDRVHLAIRNPVSISGPRVVSRLSGGSVTSRFRTGKPATQAAPLMRNAAVTSPAVLRILLSPSRTAQEGDNDVMQLSSPRTTDFVDQFIAYRFPRLEVLVREKANVVRLLELPKGGHKPSVDLLIEIENDRGPIEVFGAYGKALQHRRTFDFRRDYQFTVLRGSLSITCNLERYFSSNS